MATLAFELLADLRRRGAKFRVDSDQLRYRLPRSLPDVDEVRQVIAARKYELMEALMPPVNRQGWPPTLAKVVAWFQEVDASQQLPQEPFVLHHWAAVADPATFYRALRCDIAAGPTCFRARTGALIDDLQALHLVVKGDAAP